MPGLVGRPLPARAFGDSLVGKAAAKALGTAGELEAYNIANNIDESALGDHELTAQQLLANSGSALAIGGGLGFLMPVASKAINAGAGKAKAAATAEAPGDAPNPFPEVTAAVAPKDNPEDF